MDDAAPTQTLRLEHEVILRALAVAAALGPRLGDGRAADREALARLVELFRLFLDGAHHDKEERLLFPALERLGVPREGGPIGVMLDEHDQGRRLVRTMAEEGPARAAEAIRAFVPLLRAHIDKENEVLFPLADRILPDAEQRRLATAFEEVDREALAPPRLARLTGELARLEREAGLA